MQIKDLKPHKKNPRKMSKKKSEALYSSINKFGDLSGFLYNRRTKTLFGGQQKYKVIPPNSQIKIEQKYEKPTKRFTVAEGYVLIDGERFKYREVDAPEVWEAEAMLAANKHQGDWDKDMLKLVFADFPEIDAEIAGFDVPELEALGIPKIRIPKITVDPFADDAEEGGDAPLDLEDVTEDEDTEEDLDREESDEEYVKNTPEVSEQIPTEKLPSLINNKVENQKTNPFDKIEEKTEVPGRRIVIIIDCPTEEVKKELREKLRVQVEEKGAKFF